MNTLPNECLFEIFDNFRNQYRCLFYCLLVNRLWCKIIIPILWRNPTDHFIDKRVLKLCLSTLNDKEQTRLIPFKLNLPKFPNKLFEYTSYATSVESYRFNQPIINWLRGKEFKSMYRSLIIVDGNYYLPIMVVKFSLIEMFLRTCKKLKLLNFDGIIFDKTIFNNLYGNATITSLEFRARKSNSEAIEILVEIIRKNFIKYLNLSDNKDFNSEEWNAIAEAFHQNTTITSLDLSYNQLDFIREALRKNIGLVALAISCNAVDISDREHLPLNTFGFNEMKALAEALCVNTTLTILCVVQNYFGFEFAELLAEVLYKNITLTKLEIGIEVLAEVLCKNISLSTLNLCCNGIDSRGVKALEKVIYMNTTLTYLNLSKSNIDFEDSKVLMEALSKNLTLITLNIGHNNRLHFNLL
ncbi:RNI-like protein [Gigaspora margarita]|uniref:RNI-like protein n=1 Tax=Gigaspora margarita TaxID=4874 RepID=A0A8H3XFY5_GIGMA|nr:RNI-like protein [Gigaspora margarita]